MRIYDHGHAIFEDGHEIEFGFSGWPSELLPEDDTTETEAARQAKRLAFVKQVARDWAEPEYKAKKIKKVWLAG